MSAQGVKQQEHAARQATADGVQTGRQRTTRAVAPQHKHVETRSRPFAKGEIRDPLGDFSEAIGAYFG
ncbi:MAG: hypothetical protein RRC07_14895 [Anaerolineae bacterium]|nr:hypothetical protein [Anaerolineae bacterium]